MFEKEMAFYKAHLDEFRKKYLGKELVIVGDQLIGVYDDVGTAYHTAERLYKPGTFMMTDITEYPVTYTSGLLRITEP
jgi:hypothetical protein